ncbi:MAG TPA: DUF4097 family beta strand repeat-containing protein [Beutenbergiaceae bacterium]|nr:DUF4097 family beta strand repeat-containing protein [Beutenbergiaceae bacterium]
MNTHQFPVEGPLQVRATLRSSDLHLRAAEVTEAHVRLEPRRDDNHHRRLLEDTWVDVADGVLTIEVPRTTTLGFVRQAPGLRITVTVPTGSHLEASSGSGDLTSAGDLGAAEWHTGSGDGTFGTLRTLTAASGSGDISVETVVDGEFTTGSGHVRLGTATGSIRFKSGSGDLSADQIGDLNATPASGDIRLGEFTGAAKVRTASGDIRIRRAVRGRMAASSASGDIEIGVVPGTAVLLDCSSASGRTHTDLNSSEAPSPDENALELRARSASGDITVTRSS